MPAQERGPWEDYTSKAPPVSGGEAGPWQDYAPAKPPRAPGPVTPAEVEAHSPKTQFEKDRPGEGISLKGSGAAAWEGIKGLGAGIVHQLDPTRGLSGAGLTAIGINPRSGTTGERLNEIPVVQAAKEAKAGWKRGGLDEAALSAVGSFAGVSGESMARHGERGEGGAIIGEAAVPAATAALAPVVGDAVSGLKKIPEYVGSTVRDPATGRVRTPWEMAVDKIAPDPFKPKAIPAKTVPKGTNYGQYLEEQKVAAKQKTATQKAQEKAEGRTPEPIRLPLRETPSIRPLTPESVPGPDTAGKGNLLTPIARQGDVRAGQELMRRGRNVLYVPPEGYPTPGEALQRIRSADEPHYAYRAHDVENPVMDLERSHAHATGSLEEAQRYAEHRGAGAPQRISRINLDRLQHMKDYEEMPGPNGVKWYKFKRQLGEGEIE
jgi:hypothetical protein